MKENISFQKWAFSFEKSWFSTIKMCGDNRFSQKFKDNRA